MTFFVKKREKNRLLAIFGKISKNSKNQRWSSPDLVKIHLCAKFEPSNPNTLAAMSPKDLAHLRFYNMLSSRTSDLGWLMASTSLRYAQWSRWRFGPWTAPSGPSQGLSARLAQNPPPISSLSPIPPTSLSPTPLLYSCIYSHQTSFAVATYRPIAFFNSIPFYS